MSGDGRGLSKWQVAALGVGAVAVVAGSALVAYACIKGRRRTKEGDPKGAEEDQNVKAGVGSRSEAAAASQPPSEQHVSVWHVVLLL